MNPDNQPLEPIDPPDNTSPGTTNVETTDSTAGQESAQAPAINPPDNT